MHASCRTPKRTKRIFRHDDVWSFLLLSAAFESAASLCCVENTQRLNMSLWHPHRAVSASVGWFSQTQSWYCLISCERLSVFVSQNEKENLLIASLSTKINGGLIWFINDWIHFVYILYPNFLWGHDVLPFLSIRHSPTCVFFPAQN